MINAPAVPGWTYRVIPYGWLTALKGTYNGITFSGVIGYRALYVDYVQGEGRQRYEFDMLQHGPVG
ncbi:hypothetical protein [Microvirga brassicacearum]|uniref:Uncharacterized protein n=1 Tax=Microvirga brassicacearum TaxID=2580413 RepID=A0A5N3P7P2_9HYPH|nr:hypothetical protein [Microvirga brassicacearum]KAB0265749.1 hypothetical protein FEZ63_17205 [Microvirga brassicacearum]